MLAAILGMAMAKSPWEIVVLGVAQDAGIPHLGCEKGICAEIRAGKKKPEKVSCLGLINRQTGDSYLFDATPDIRAQLISMNGGKKPSGVFLTHGHMGHYSGLLYFGRESADWKEVTVYGSARMSKYLESNDPWKFILSRNLSFRQIAPDQPLELPGGVKVTAFSVPHRDEFTDTFGFRIEGPEKKAIFIPDIDRWEKWDRDIRKIADENDLLFLDGTFSTPEEIGARDITQIPHPMIPGTRELLKGSKGKVWFIHLNHTNPALNRDKDVVKEGMRFGI
jgi:pyrroloquinoline quinone biosynthesis protein B